VTAESDEDAIWRTVMAEHVAYWMRDVPALEALFVHAPYFRWWAGIGAGGATLTNGWDAYLMTLRIDIVQDPDRNPFFAYRARFEDCMIRIGGDMAFVTYRTVFPTEDMPGFHGPETGHHMKILERVGARWLIAGTVVLDDQFGQTEVPMWEIDPAGRIVRQSPAATRYLETEPDRELSVRAGRLHLGDAETNRRLQQAMREAKDAAWGGVMATSMAIPIVFDPGNDLPARVWWAGRRGTILYVALNDPSLIAARIERAAAAFGLSPSQRRLTASIVEGRALTDAAAREGIRISTARTQLQRIFDKVGVRTQPALVRALLAVAGPA
jgi:DNA-binding CsgD family transcriptional regulator